MGRPALKILVVLATVAAVVCSLPHQVEAEDVTWFQGFENSSSSAPVFDAHARLAACRSLVATPAPVRVIDWKDPLFVIWFPPASNSSFEHEWLEDTILAKVNRWRPRHGVCVCVSRVLTTHVVHRPVIYHYPEGCHLNVRYRGTHVPKHVLYVIGAGTHE
jgi:hypothetical protein